MTVFSKRSTFETVSIASVFIGVFGRFGVDMLGENAYESPRFDTKIH